MNSVDQSVEDILADPAFGTLKRYVIQATGLSYYEDRDRDLARGVVLALGEAKIRSIHEYMMELSSPVSPTLDRLVEELTIGETFFFRHSEMFDALRDHVFPEIRARKGEQRHLRIWSAGCSIGAEPYSISILLRRDLAYRFRDWKIEIIGTDINRRFLKIAREGAYEPWALRGMPEEMLRNCFDRQDKKWVLKRIFTEGVTFQQHNLVQDGFPSLGNNLFGLDLAICRNVMIYFNHDTIRQLAAQFHQSLLPGGWLLVGHAEPHTEIFRAFQTVNAPGAILYQRSVESIAHPSTFEKLNQSAQSDRLPTWYPPVLGIPSSIVPTEVPSFGNSKFGGTADSEADGCEGLSRIRELADAGELVAARVCCEHLLESVRLDPEAYLLYGLILEQLDAFVAAREAFRRVIYLDRTLVLGHYHLATVLQKLGEASQATRALRNAAALTEGLKETELVRYGDGMTVGDLRNAIAMQMKHLPGRIL